MAEDRLDPISGASGRQPTGSGPNHDRRDALRKVGIGAGVAWSAPIVSSFFTAAAAGTGPPPPQISPPMADCVAGRCGDAAPCSSADPDCVCARTAMGTMCIPGRTPCEVGPRCGPDLECVPGSVCVLDSCCFAPICVPLDLLAECPPDDPADPAVTATSRIATGAGTIGG